MTKTEHPRAPLAVVGGENVEAGLNRTEPTAMIKVDLDERAFLMPVPKQLTHLQLLVFKPNMIRLEGVFLFNASGASTELVELTGVDATELATRLIDSVYRAQSSVIVTKTTSLTVSVVTNGYVLQFGDLTNPRELFLSTSCIWRVCSGLARAVDFLSHSARH